MKKRVLGLLGLLSLTTLASCQFLGNSSSSGNSNQGEDVTGNNSDVTIADDSITADFYLYDESGMSITPSNGIYTIDSAGTYKAVGKLSDGQIYVNAEEQDIELVLEGVSISNSSDAPIYVNTCNDFTIKSKKDTTNYIYDTRTTDYSESTDKADATAAIYSLDGDIKLNGQGTLQVISSKNSGIHSRDNVTVKNVTMLVKAQNNGIKGADKVTIEEDPTLGIVCGNNGIVTSNSDVTESSQHGYIYINGGTITINSYGDGIDAAYAVVIGTSTDDEGVTYEPTLDIYTNIYSSYTDTSTTYTNALNPGPGGGGFDGGGMEGGTSAEKADDSAKAIKANETIDINAGEIFTYTYDDSIHANNDDQLENGSYPSGAININGGVLNIKASDDGIHADGTLNINGGEIYISESYEGIEGKYVNITGGDTTIYADNDGANAGTKLTISGGRLDVNMASSGDVDGIDSNGSISITGGVVITRGPNGANASAMDADGSVSISGGIVIIVGYCNQQYISKGNGITVSTLSNGLSSGTYTVTAGSNSVTYMNSYSYSGKVYVFATSSASIK